MAMVSESFVDGALVAEVLEAVLVVGLEEDVERDDGEEVDSEPRF